MAAVQSASSRETDPNVFPFQVKEAGQRRLPLGNFWKWTNCANYKRIIMVSAAPTPSSPVRHHSSVRVSHIKDPALYQLRCMWSEAEHLYVCECFRTEGAVCVIKGAVCILQSHYRRCLHFAACCEAPQFKGKAPPFFFFKEREKDKKPNEQQGGT